jgi:hypothetical protein
MQKSIGKCDLCLIKYYRRNDEKDSGGESESATKPTQNDRKHELQSAHKSACVFENSLNSNSNKMKIGQQPSHQTDKTTATTNGINETNKQVCFDTHNFGTKISCKTQLWKRKNDAVNDYLVVKAFSTYLVRYRRVNQIPKNICSLGEMIPCKEWISRLGKASDLRNGAT